MISSLLITATKTLFPHKVTFSGSGVSTSACEFCGRGSWGKYNSACNNGYHAFLLKCKLISFWGFWRNLWNLESELPRLVITSLEMSNSLHFTKSFGHSNLQNGTALGKPSGHLARTSSPSYHLKHRVTRNQPGSLPLGQETHLHTGFLPCCLWERPHHADEKVKCREVGSWWQKWGRYQIFWFPLLFREESFGCGNPQGERALSLRPPTPISLLPVFLRKETPFKIQGIVSTGGAGNFSLVQESEEFCWGLVSVGLMSIRTSRFTVTVTRDSWDTPTAFSLQALLRERPITARMLELLFLLGNWCLCVGFLEISFFRCCFVEKVVQVFLGFRTQFLCPLFAPLSFQVFGWHHYFPSEK